MQRCSTSRSVAEMSVMYDKKTLLASVIPRPWQLPVGSIPTVILRIALQPSILFCCAPAVHRRQPTSSASLHLRGVKCRDMCGQVAVMRACGQSAVPYVRRISVM